MAKNKAFIIVLALFNAVFAVSGYMLFSYYRTAHSENEQFEQLRQIIVVNQTESNNPIIPIDNVADGETTPPVDEVIEPFMLPHMAELFEKNSDIAAWVKIDGTRIDYPIMHTPNEPQKYLRRAFDGRYAESGVPFIGGGSPLSDNPIIYGHNMKNGTMFTDLLKYERRDFWKTHRIIQLDTLYERQEYEVIAAFRSRAYAIGETGFRYYLYTNFGDENTFSEYIGQVEKAALYDTGISAAYGDTFITLSTCAYHTTDGRFVVVARRIK